MTSGLDDICTRGIWCSNMGLRRKFGAPNLVLRRDRSLGERGQEAVKK